MKRILSGLALAGVLAASGHAAAQSAADPLTKLEQAAEAQPDDLRPGNDYRMAVIQAAERAAPGGKLAPYDRALAFF